MKKMSIEEVQSVCFELLKHVDAFCKEKKIAYFLDGGTLIGAARHGGFIPWDDDLDIIMPRPDYERFVNEYEDSDQYRLYAPFRHSCYRTHARLCEMKRTFFGQEAAVWTLENPGVGIDILPLDGAPDSKEEYDKVLEHLRNLQAGIFEYRRKRWRKFRKTPMGFLKDCIHFAGFLFRLPRRDSYITRNVAEIERIRRALPYETATLCGYPVVEGRAKYLRKDWYSSAIEMDFCGEKFPVPVGYDERLTAEYGDWRTPPPVSQRSGHKSWKMWWRD